MSEMNEKADEPQEQAADRLVFRELTPEDLQRILEAHRKWVESGGNEGKRADLRWANLQEAVLREANLQGADLQGANLQEAFLWGANLSKAFLDKANLQAADLIMASLKKAYLVLANLQKANLGEANLQEASLGAANLQEAVLASANLQGAALFGAKGLIASQVKTAKNWELAFYSDDFLKKLGLPPDHNERVKKKLAELEKEKKATGGK